MPGHDMSDMRAMIRRRKSCLLPVKMTGIGNSHITIKATPEAQAWFDQGLSLLHDFWDYESQKAFEQSIRVDPQCAMCWWGLAAGGGFTASALRGARQDGAGRGREADEPRQRVRQVLH